MEIKRDRMVFLGYGKYWRSDGIVGLMPIEDERGPGRRTNVFVAGRAEPIVASRTEESILEDMGATDEAFQIQALREAVRELLAAFHEFSPVLRRALLAEHHFDVEKWEQRLGEILRPPSASPPKPPAGSATRAASPPSSSRRCGSGSATTGCGPSSSCT